MIEEWPAPADGPNYRRAAELMAHPLFDVAVDAVVDGLADLYGSDRRLVRSLFEFDRAVTFMIAVCVAMNHRDDRPEGWLSVPTLAQAAALMGIGPVRRVRRIVEELRREGMIEALPMPHDARRHWLRPTAAMLAIDREWMAMYQRPLLLLYPDEPRYQLGAAGDPDYHRRFRVIGLATLPLAHKVMTANPSVDRFLQHTSGGRILAILLQSARDGDDGWTPPGFYTGAAQRSATTRVHVRSVLRAAADAGLVEIVEGSDGRVRPTARLVDDFARWVADCLSATDLVSVLSDAI
ncbi:hypothetical protein M9980_09910 [Sphingomonas donggukensis]|uniref:MarR family transcriptional regulator n=1 Tax=Sphingomonas donggukensis TaxID=2949093 RepID=A0ABY4TR67_9SPHN|nr:hypothetical protein [Sphingomonas donggukensis]URW74879.1 hypothetical protein M9980_09910 [Sphingomonas donggukensis]